MLKSVTVEEIDQLLDELERLAVDASRRRFYLTVLERLRVLLGAVSVSFLVRTTDDQWLAIARSGAAPARLPSPAISAQAVQSGRSDWRSSDGKQLAVPLRRSGSQSAWRRGALYIEFNVAPTEAESDDLLKLCDAFAETIALRQSRELESFLDRDWPAFQQSVSSLASTPTLKGATYSLVNDLVVLTNADRVALLEMTTLGPRVQCVSGVVELKQNGATVAKLQQLCQQAMRDGKSQVGYISTPIPIAQDALDEAGHTTTGQLLDNYILLPVIPSGQKPSKAVGTAILFEWSDYDRFLLGTTMVQLIFPTLATAWLQHQRWLRVPYSVRQLFGRRSRVARGWIGSLIRLAALAATIIAGVWLLSLPAELRIEATGTLQPVDQRIVFAPLDGVVSRIVVQDGQTIEQGELLAELSSPMLDIELEEVAGEMRANAEKLSGLKVAINQLSPEDPSAMAMQNKFSSEIREIETRLVALNEKQRALLGEKEKLTIVAPIGGTVIARQVERYLDRRPVRRGDPLLRVVRMDGPWRLELEVADRDAGRVKRQLFSSSQTDQSEQTPLPASGPVPAAATKGLDFVYAATPDKRWQAEVIWISESTRNPQGDTAIVDVHAQVDPDTAAAGHMGATVQAYFPCGEEPIWFVWSRPLIEAIQRKLWF